MKLQSILQSASGIITPCGLISKKVEKMNEEMGKFNQENLQKSIFPKDFSIPPTQKYFCVRLKRS